MKGTLYQSSLVQECNPIWLMRISLKDVKRLSNALHHDRRRLIVSTGSATQTTISNDSIDYIWVDPPFGKNLMYAELNQVWEWWLRVNTAEKAEAVIDEKRAKSLDVYKKLMFISFKEAYRILKPNRWITIEFHNSKNTIWNAIQESLTRAGFIVADVRMLDKKLMTYKQSQQGLVKVDLVISAYKPPKQLEDTMTIIQTTEASAWEFVRYHLANLPVFVGRHGKVEVLVERQAHMLYDRMIAFHISRSLAIPISSGDFYAGLDERFPSRSEMYFLAEQVSEYDKGSMSVDGVEQMEFFVNNEATAIQWCRLKLKEKPQTFSDLQPQFMREVSAWKTHERRLELSDLLEESFLCYNGIGEVPTQIHSYISTQFKDLRNLQKDHPQLRSKAKDRWYVPDPKKNIDVDAMRNRRLLEEFWTYLPEGFTSASRMADRGQILPGLDPIRPKNAKSRKLREVRTEAIRVGFKHCYQHKDYSTILAIAGHLPENVIEEDEQLQMIHDMAEMRAEG